MCKKKRSPDKFEAFPTVSLFKLVNVFFNFDFSSSLVLHGDYLLSNSIALHARDLQSGKLGSHIFGNVVTDIFWKPRLRALCVADRKFLLPDICSFINHHLDPDTSWSRHIDVGQCIKSYVMWENECRNNFPTVSDHPKPHDVDCVLFHQYVFESGLRFRTKYIEIFVLVLSVWMPSIHLAISQFMEEWFANSYYTTDSRHNLK